MFNKFTVSTLALGMLSFQIASARILSDVPTTLIEEDSLVLSGRKLDTSVNPIIILVKTADGSSTTLNPTVISKNKVLVQMPSVSADTKILVQVSGGNIPSSSPEQFVILVLDRPNIAGLDTQANGAVALPSTVSSDFHASSANRVTDASQSAITTLPALAVIGATGLATTVKGSLVVTGGITGTATNALSANSAAVASSFSGSLTGDVSGTQGATSISSTTVIGKSLTGFSAVAGTVDATDTIKSAFENVVGNLAATDATVASHTSTLASHTTTLANHTSSIAANTTDIAANTTTIAGHTTTLANHTASIATNATNIAANTTTIATNTADISAANTVLAGHTTTLTSHASSIATNASNITANTAAIATNTSDIAAVNTVLAGHTTSLASHDSTLTSHASSIATNASNITANTAAIVTNTSDITANTTAIATNTSNISANTASIATNTSDIAANTTAITTNSSNISANTTAISTLNSDLVTLNGEVTVLNGDLATLNGEVTVLNGDLATLNGEVTVINGTVASHTSTLASLASSIATNTAAIATNTSDIAANTTNISANTTAIAGKQDASANLTAFALKTAPDGDVLGTSDAQNITNKKLQDATVSFADNSDITKVLKFELAGIGSGTTQTVSVPNASGTMTLLGNTATGTGDVVLATSPVLITPNIGAATATTVNKVIITQPIRTATLDLINGSTLKTDAAYSVNLHATNTTNITLPVSGTLATTGDLAAKQDYDAGLTSLAAQDGAANTVMYTTAANTYAATSITSYARANLALSSVTSAVETSGLVSNTYNASGVGFVIFTDAAPNINNDISVITGGTAGQRLMIVIASNSANNVVIVNNNTTINLSGGNNFTGGPGDTLELVSDGTGWYEVGNSNN